MLTFLKQVLRTRCVREVQPGLIFVDQCVRICAWPDHSVYASCFKNANLGSQRRNLQMYRCVSGGAISELFWVPKKKQRAQDEAVRLQREMAKLKTKMISERRSTLAKYYVIDDQNLMSFAFYGWYTAVCSTANTQNTVSEAQESNWKKQLEKGCSQLASSFWLGFRH